MDEVKTDVVANVSTAPAPEAGQTVTTDKAEVKSEVAPVVEAKVPDVTTYKPDQTKSVEDQLKELDKLRGKWANEVGETRKQILERDKKIAELQASNPKPVKQMANNGLPMISNEELERGLAEDPVKCLQDVMNKSVEIAEKRAEDRFYRLQTERTMDEALVTQYPDVAKENSPLYQGTVGVLAEYQLPTELTILAARTAAAELKVKELESKLGSAKGEAYQTIAAKTADNPVNAPAKLSAGGISLTPEEVAFCKRTNLDQKRFAELKADESK